jgi:hypothetical protein
MTIGDQVRINAPGSEADGIVGYITEDYRADCEPEEAMDAVLVTYGPGMDIMVGTGVIEVLPGGIG